MRLKPALDIAGRICVWAQDHESGGVVSVLAFYFLSEPHCSSFTKRKMSLADRLDPRELRKVSLKGLPPGAYIRWYRIAAAVCTSALSRVFVCAFCAAADACTAAVDLSAAAFDLDAATAFRTAAAAFRAAADLIAVSIPKRQHKKQPRTKILRFALLRSSLHSRMGH